MNINKLTKVSLTGILVTVLTPFTTAYANNLSTEGFNNEAQNQLGPNVLPVMNTTAFACISNCYSSVGTSAEVFATGEITYWSPAPNNGGPDGSWDVTQTRTGTITLLLNVPGNFFPPNGAGSSNANGFLAATLSSTLTNAGAETISFATGTDDMAFACLDGQIVCDHGSVHAYATGNCTTFKSRHSLLV